MPAAIPFITSSNASDLAKLSWERRRAKPEPKQDIADPQQEAKTQALACVREQMKQVDEAIASIRMIQEAEYEGEPSKALILRAAAWDATKAWDALTRAKERLFRAWVHLAGIPGPGQLKPTQPRQPKPTQVEPIE